MLKNKKFQLFSQNIYFFFIFIDARAFLDQHCEDQKLIYYRSRIQVIYIYKFVYNTRGVL